MLSGFEDVVEALLQAGADVNARSLDYGTPLCLAAFRGRQNVVNLLLEYRANVHISSQVAGAPLHCSVYAAGIPEIAEVLINNGASLECVNTIRYGLLDRLCHDKAFPAGATQGSTNDKSNYCWFVECQPLVLAAMRGRNDLVDLFLNAHCNANAMYREWHTNNMANDFDDVDRSAKEERRTPLMAACEQKRSEIVTNLLRAAANVHARDGRDSTALHVAAVSGSLDCVRALVEAGAEVEATNKYSHTALLNAII